MIRFLSTDAPEREKLEAIRASITAVSEQLAAIEDAPLPADEAAERFLRALNERRAIGEVRLAYYAGAEHTPSPDGDILTFMLVRLLGDDLDERAQEFFRARASDDAIPSGDRLKKIAALKKKIRKLEIDEEVEVSRLEAEGYAVDRRSGIDVETILAAWEAR